MNSKAFITILILFALLGHVFAGSPDSLVRSRNTIALSQSRHGDDLDEYLQYGVHIGTDLNLTSKWLSDYDYMKTHFSGMFGFYVRGGYHYIFGETGIEYIFHKCYYSISGPNETDVNGETVESRYLQIPFKVVGQLRVGELCAFLPYTGIIYKPLIHCSKNDIGYGRDNLTRHQCLFTAGLDFRIKFVTIGAGYQINLKPYFSNVTSIKQQYLNITLGVQL